MLFSLSLKTNFTIGTQPSALQQCILHTPGEIGSTVQLDLTPWLLKEIWV